MLENKDISEVKVQAESTYLNPAIKAKEQLIDWMLVGLGAPLQEAELDEQLINYCILNALEKYTKYAYFGDKYLAVNLKFYEHGKGLNLEKFSISYVKDISFLRDNAFMMNGDLFWGPYAFMGQGGGAGYPFFNGNGANGLGGNGSWVTWHMVNEFFELSHRMTGSNPDFLYDKTTKYLKLMPEPKCHGDSFALLTCLVEPPLEVLYGNEYVKRLALAYARQLIHFVRAKYTGINMPGGGQLNTELFAGGTEEVNKIIEEIQRDEARGQYWCIA